MVFREIIEEDQYRIPYMRPTDSVVDIGAHIGCATLLCMMRGAGKVLAFEPDPDNFALLERNVAGQLGITAVHAAVWQEGFVTYSGYPGGNTACGSCMPDVTVGGKNDELPVPTVTLDHILAQMQPQRRLRLLKIDCEGGEFPILYTSKRLAQIDEIVGEIHHMPWLKNSGLVEGFTDYDPDELTAHLERNGFSVSMEKLGPQWLFWATNTHRAKGLV